MAVKLLKNVASFEARRDFCHEVKVMASFDHENILRLIGIVSMGTSRLRYLSWTRDVGFVGLQLKINGGFVAYVTSFLQA